MTIHHALTSPVPRRKTHKHNTKNICMPTKFPRNRSPWIINNTYTSCFLVIRIFHSSSSSHRRLPRIYNITTSQTFHAFTMIRHLACTAVIRHPFPDSASRPRTDNNNNINVSHSLLYIHTYTSVHSNPCYYTIPISFLPPPNDI